MAGPQLPCEDRTADAEKIAGFESVFKENNGSPGAKASWEAWQAAIDLPVVPPFSRDTLAAAGLSNDDVARIRDILDSYHYTNALALVALSALVMHFEPTQQDTVRPLDGSPRPLGKQLPELPPMQSLKPEVVRLIEELNGFGEDTDKSLIASMYRHLGYWPIYLSLVRTMLALGDQWPTAHIDPFNS